MKRMRRFTVIILAIIIVSSILPSGVVLGKPSEEQVKAFSKVKSVHLSVKQNYNEAKKASLPVEDMVEDILNSIGIKISKSPVLYDATINIKINGNPLGFYFSETTVYSGAKLSGVISFEFKDKNLSPYRKSFTGQIEPNSSNIPVTENMVDPSNAPFKEAFIESDFYENFIGMIGELRGNSAMINCWIALLRRDDYSIQFKSINALTKIGKPAVKPLISNLNDKDNSFRMAVIETLGKIKDPVAVGPLISLIKDEDSSIRMRAAEALGNIGDKRAVEPLISLIKDEDSWVRMAVVEALGKIKDPRGVEPLISALKDKDSWVKMKAIEALRDIKDQRAVDPLLTSLKDSNASVRTRAAEALGALKNPKAVPALIERLKDKEADVRMRSAEALGNIGDKRAVKPLIASLKDEDWTVRLRAAEALGKIGDSNAVKPLIDALNDKEWTVRSSAAEALGKIRDPKAIDPLIKLLNDKDISVRLSAIEALGEIGDKKAIEPLRKVASNDSSQMVKEKAKEILNILQK